jgi:DNA invertase Pin-like site-specific DNA recombinase
MRDMAKKKRWFSYPSAEHPSARLTEDAVRAIRASSENYAALGRRYGVHKHTIYLIRSRKTWRNLA